jgi:hypothetical protein
MLSSDSGVVNLNCHGDYEKINLPHNNILKKTSIFNYEIEERSQFFDVVPDARLFFQSFMPVMNIRFNAAGLIMIAKRYENLYNINILVHQIKINSSEFSIDGSVAEMIFSDESLYEKITFNNNQINGIIINVVNNEERLMHSMPIIFGAIDGKKVVIFFDRYFEFFDKIDYESCVFCGSKNIINKLGADINIYLHNEIIQIDQHSCAIIALLILKKCLSNNDIIHEIMHNSQQITDEYLGYFSKFNLPEEISSLRQNNFSGEEIVSKKLLKVDKRYLPYNPNQIIDFNEIEMATLKTINISLLFRSHKYAEYIMQNYQIKTTENKSFAYNPTFWLYILQKNDEQEQTLKHIKQNSNQLKNHAISSIPQEAKIDITKINATQYQNKIF